jgi:hypothetical protein
MTPQLLGEELPDSPQKLPRKVYPEINNFISEFLTSTENKPDPLKAQIRLSLQDAYKETPEKLNAIDKIKDQKILEQLDDLAAKLTAKKKEGVAYNQIKAQIDTLLSGKKVKSAQKTEKVDFEENVEVAKFKKEDEIKKPSKDQVYTEGLNTNKKRKTLVETLKPPTPTDAS